MLARPLRLRQSHFPKGSEDEADPGCDFMIVDRNGRYAVETVHGHESALRDKLAGKRWGVCDHWGIDGRWAEGYGASVPPGVARARRA
jgi:hypothetical protein